jgi:pimeloyl-ACP methyl ester carboxylesterase
MILAEENCYFDLRGARQAHAEVKKIHTLLGSPDSAEISVGHLDHGFHKHAREAMYGFFIKHAGLDVECQEAPMEEIAETQLNAAEGEVVPFGSKKIFGFTQARAKELIAQRPLLEYSGLQEAVSRLLQIQAPDTPPHFRYLRRSGGQEATTGKGYQFAVESEAGIQVILTMFGDLENQCRRPQGPVSLFVGHLSSEEDCAALPWLQRRLTEGQRILAADLRGTGQSFPNSCGSSDMLEPYGADYLYASFGSMMGESYLGRRVLDLLRTIDCLVDGGAEVHLIGRGVGSVAVALAALLHASQPTCELVHYLPSYQLLIDNPLHNWPFSTMLENCLATFDLPDIYAALGERLQKCDPWGPWI